MGLRDILTGMQNGPRGQRPPTSGGSGGGMSPIVLALLGLLAYKALKGRGGQTANPGGAGQTTRLPPGGTAQPGNAGGGLGDILGGLFGGGGRFGTPTGGFNGFGGPTKGGDITANTTLDFLTAIRGDTVGLKMQDRKSVV